ncbi:MAG: retropepsin-like domain-containing protein [Candidatus Omnitrophica bacterium]|nr:retropepsin-like domain-containing protein [Candidatus Omnitrophota bacterium]
MKKEMHFPYLKYLVTSPSVKPAQYIYRPAIPVRLSLEKKIITFDGLIDSGADECTFPAWIAKTLGHNVYKGKQKIFSGIGGSVLSYLHKTHIRLDGIEFITDAYYSHEWDDMPFGLLGQAGFFQHFDIDFHYKKKEIVLKALK